MGSDTDRELDTAQLQALRTEFEVDDSEHPRTTGDMRIRAIPDESMLDQSIK